MELWKGAPVAETITQKAARQAEQLKAKGIVPTLAVLRVGEREDDLSYERGIYKRFEKAGAQVRVAALPADVEQALLEKQMIELNQDPSVHGILMFRPLPRQLDGKRLAALIDPAKDVDGMNPQNAAKIYAGDRDGFAPCTAAAVMAILAHYQVNLQGKRAVVVGRSPVIGRPLSMMLLAEHATVTICHTKTVDLPAACRQAEILVAAAGVPRLLNDAYLSPNQIVLDVGIHMTENGLCGDVDEQVTTPLLARTPVPGGVGSVTTSILLQQTLEAALRQNS